MTIRKFPVLSTGPCDIAVPAGGVLLSVGRDPATGLIAFWAEVDPASEGEPRRFQVIGTGQDIPDRAAYRGSAVIGELVLHLYEIARPADGSWA